MEVPMRKTTLVAGLAGALVACAVGTDPQLSYDAGYRLGCRTGEMYAGRPIAESPPDAIEYQTNAAYADGYDTAVDACYERARRTQPHWGGNGR